MIYSCCKGYTGGCGPGGCKCRRKFTLESVYLTDSINLMCFYNIQPATINLRTHIQTMEVEEGKAGGSGINTASEVS